VLCGLVGFVVFLWVLGGLCEAMIGECAWVGVGWLRRVGCGDAWMGV
jgi:hypothetical protein